MILLDNCNVKMTQVLADDSMVIAAARVSTDVQAALAALEGDPLEGAGLINFLMKNRHGTPFEHNLFTFFVEAPIFVFREFHRHRIGWSYNETSGRYTELADRFYIPPRHRPLVQTGKPGHYILVPGSAEQYELMAAAQEETYIFAWHNYQRQIAAGIAKEVARNVLPVGIMSSMWATCNARSMMAFLSLRTDEPQSKFPSKPQWEIDNLVARVFEGILEENMPLTFEAFCNNGRVAP